MKGIGNSLDFGARIYDSRTGKWLSLDPLQAKYPNLSPYHFAGNNPIYYIDPDGKILKISKAGDYALAQKDILSLAGKHGAMFEIQKDGAVKSLVSKAQAEATRDPGVILLYNLSDSKKVYSYGADDKSDYKFAEQTMKNGKWETKAYGDKKSDNLNGGHGISNHSTQAYGRSKDKDGHEVYKDHVLVPGNSDVNSEVTINPKAQFKEKLKDGGIINKSRESVVLHEMQEASNRTDGEMEYQDAHNAANQTERDMRSANPTDIRTSENQGSPGVNPQIER